ncbi:MAG: Gfo/Idh/MocA family oxidoreductase [Acholeplasmatales bacterium]|nr:Gfo/Idh/MocA family oxidoreductase [Acholeplasmatales bacterium]
MKIGILGLGHIANSLCETINKMDSNYELYAVASRDIIKSLEYKKKYNATKAYGSYLDLVKDDEVDLIYIATINSLHYEHMRLCIEHKKNILVEKPFTLNYSEAIEIEALAKKNNVFVAEALWTSYMPFNNILSDLLKNEVVKSFYGVFNVNVINHERINKKELGGGALLDLGIYPISFALRLFGFSYKDIIINNMYFSNSNVDTHTDISIMYDDFEARCVCNCTKDYQSYVNIVTKNYRIYIDNAYNPTFIKVFNRKEVLVKEYNFNNLTGYEFEVMDCYNSIKDGLLEPRKWSHFKTLELMHILDTINIKAMK